MFTAKAHPPSLGLPGYGGQEGRKEYKLIFVAPQRRRERREFF